MRATKTIKARIYSGIAETIPKTKTSYRKNVTEPTAPQRPNAFVAGSFRNRLNVLMNSFMVQSKLTTLRKSSATMYKAKNV